MPAVFDHVHRASLVERAALQMIAFTGIAYLKAPQRKIFVQLDGWAIPFISQTPPMPRRAFFKKMPSHQPRTAPQVHNVVPRLWMQTPIQPLIPPPLAQL